MNGRLTETAAAVGGIAYLLLFGWAISNTTYDEWGALVIIPAAALLGVVIIRAMFTGSLESLRPILYAGMGMKLIGTGMRYWVGFEAYGGAIDAGRYHDYAVGRVAQVRDGNLTYFDLVPSGTGTPFVEDVTALIYAITGSSQMGGFVVFGFIGFVGTLFFVKAACVAIPGLATHRYAVLCMLAPSLAYWPSSIGKEVLMLFGLGVATLGIARFCASGAVASPMVLVLIGFAFTGAIRPHMAGLWLAGVFPALLVKFVQNLRLKPVDGARRTSQGLILGVIGVAAVGMVVLATAAVEYLDPGGDDEGGVTSIIEETQRRTTQARSSFEPPNVSNPTNWPFAIVRTLTRPLPHEASGIAQLMTAAEMALLIGLALLSYRRVMHLPKLLVKVPYVAFAMTTLALAGLAFSSFANLGVLARQKSLVFPFLLLIVCLPALPRRAEHDPEGDRAQRRDDLETKRFLTDHFAVPAGVSHRGSVVIEAEAQNSSTSPSERPQLLSGGMPASFTARHVSTGPPPGNGAYPDDDLFAPRRTA